ncbi:MAG: very short patch repair endonuclease [Methanomassiliicoccales archaeon]|nr:MAG: very short patch repair endonuclease [Methanomassiliicoccales archaeon]
MKKRRRTKSFIRDGRCPIPVSESTSVCMRSNKGKDTGPEVKLRKKLRENGIYGYRVSYGKLPGRPDIAFVRKKVAIFVNGCFWHRCPLCNLPVPKSHSDFWQNKFEKNIKRDAEVKKELEAIGWTPLVIWECQIKRDIQMVVDMIINLVKENE